MPCWQNAEGLVMSVKAGKIQTNAQIITARRNQALDRQGYVDLVLRILTLLLVGWVLRTQVFLITQVNGNDMFPAV